MKIVVRFEDGTKGEFEDDAFETPTNDAEIKEIIEIIKSEVPEARTVFIRIK